MEDRRTDMKYRFSGHPLNSGTNGEDSSDWNLNDWKWDGDLFKATPVNLAPSDCGSRQFFPVAPENPSSAGLSEASLSGNSEDIVQENGKTEAEKKRRVVEVDEGVGCDDGRCLSLKLGGQVYYPAADGDAKGGKKTKYAGSIPSLGVCQVEGCKADLSNSKDYLRRHKVCEAHSKASEALVRGVKQRFCQQCSRFQPLREFDTDRRSCRRRLEGHNKRRRKTHPEPNTHPEANMNGESACGERNTSYLLLTLLRILTDTQASHFDQNAAQGLYNLLQNAAGMNAEPISRWLQDLGNAGTATGTSGQTPVLPPCGPESAKASGFHSTMNGTNFQDPQKNSSQPLSMHTANTQSVKLQTKSEKTRLVDIDLNNVCNEAYERMENLERSDAPSLGNGSVAIPILGEQDSQKTGTAQNSSNSNSTSSQSLSSSSEEVQNLTVRVTFKLFGKSPKDIPGDLRTQMLQWLSSIPTDMESQIRPGCIILTVYVRLKESILEELCYDLGSNLGKLLDASNDSFWRTGWICTRIGDSVAFAYNGDVVLDTTLPSRSHDNCRIALIKPIAVSDCESARFSVKGFNLLQSTSRLLCNLQGKYLAQRSCHDLIDRDKTENGKDQLQHLSFCCSIPKVTGRGFIEVEDHGLSSTFFPFIVAEEEVCSEIRMLENAIEAVANGENTTGKAEESRSAEARNEALNFIHEMGWLLQRSSLKVRFSGTNHGVDLFPFKRFKWLMEFAMENDWCAVVKKLLTILFDGIVETEESLSVDRAVLDMSLLHRAVTRNCRAMVEFLLDYVPEAGSTSEQKLRVGQAKKSFIFKPDTVGPAGLTPLHIAASKAGSEQVLDALTNDPESVGLEAWRTARDKSGLTPNDYACLKRHYSYIQLVQRKINRRKSDLTHSVVDIPSALMCANAKNKSASLETEKIQLSSLKGPCRLCERKIYFGNQKTHPSYKLAMFSMIAIAAVCVCVALLFRGSPEVDYSFRPFRWEMLKYGPR